jgi:hypothetical protein
MKRSQLTSYWAVDTVQKMKFAFRASVSLILNAPHVGFHFARSATCRVVRRARSSCGRLDTSLIIAACDLNHGNGFQPASLPSAKLLRAMIRRRSLIFFAGERAVAVFTCKTAITWKKDIKKICNMAVKDIDFCMRLRTLRRWVIGAGIALLACRTM